MNSRRYSLACAVIGLILWLDSYLWVPLSLIPSLQGRDLSFLAPVLPASEAGASLIAMVGLVLGYVARQSSQPETPDYRSASRRLALNVLVLIIVPNLVGPLLLDG